MIYGHFDDEHRSYVVTDPLPPRPWINYLGNRRLTAFMSQNAGGLMWYREPYSRRISRYHYIPAPADRPGFYVYVRDRRTGDVWNPHFAPVCAEMDYFECRHEPGVSSFVGEKSDVRIELSYAIPPEEDVMVWRVVVSNLGAMEANIQTVSYLEFGLLEFMREIIGWCYLKNQVGFRFDEQTQSIRYEYQVFEAPFTPCMAFACSREVSGFECARDQFVGRSGSLQFPAALQEGAELGGSELPMGGDHGAGVLGVDMKLGPGASRTFCYMFCYGEDWRQVDDLIARYRRPEAAGHALDAVRGFWRERLERLEVRTGDPATDRFVNTWTPFNAAVALELCRRISTDHMGMDGLRYRDTTQDALGVANFDPEFALHRMRQVFAEQRSDGAGCYAFFPYSPRPTATPKVRSDNTVWQIYTMRNLIAETGDLDVLSEDIPFADAGSATIYEHIRLGLHYIWERCGPRGLPTLFDVDWNDNLELFGDRDAESVMLGMQLVYACREFSLVAERLDRESDVAWCAGVVEELTDALNGEDVWDGQWYRRLLLSNGKYLGSGRCREGQIYLNPQAWSVISGVGACRNRGRRAMDSAADLLDTPFGLRVLSPPYTGIPEPEDPPLGSQPGTNENGGIFCHANTWAIIAEALLGNAARAWKYYRQLLPEVVIGKVGCDHYQREPYVHVSTITGPPSKRFGEGGISWLTGTTNWMYVAATHYLLGLRPTLDGLRLQPCLPGSIEHVQVRRIYRGCTYEIEMHNEGAEACTVEVDGGEIEGTLLPVAEGEVLRVVCRC